MKQNSRGVAGKLALVGTAAAIATIAILVRPHAAQNTAFKDGAFVCFSLAEAERLVASGHANDETRNLGHISHLVGMVRDPASNDLILIGQVDSNGPQNSLDALVVAIRAVCKSHRWPSVSIDRTADTATTNMQVVKMDGGIQDSTFGAEMLDADADLKKIALALLPADDLGGSYLKRVVALIRTAEGQRRVGSRFWFVPAKEELAMRENVFAIIDTEMEIRTQILSVDGVLVPADSTATDPIGDDFSKSLNAHYAALSARYKSIGRLKALLDLTAIASGIESLEASGAHPNLNYWLNGYRLPAISTQRQYPLLRNSAPVDVEGDRMEVQLDGGIELKALVLRLQSGDITAMQEMVLKSRPKSDALTWSIPVAVWKLPGFRFPGKEADGTVEAEESQTKRETKRIGTTISRGLVNPLKPNTGIVVPPSPDLPSLPPTRMRTDHFAIPPQTRPVDPPKTDSRVPNRPNSPSFLPVQPAQDAHMRPLPNRVNGVNMKIDAKGEGTGGDEVKQSILSSRPSDSAVSFKIRGQGTGR